MPRTPMTFSKRQREQAKRDKRTAKAERKALRKSGALPLSDEEMIASPEGGDDQDADDSEEEETAETSTSVT